MIVAGKLARFLPEISFYHYIGTDDRVVGVVPECVPSRAPARGSFGGTTGGLPRQEHRGHLSRI